MSKKSKSPKRLKRPLDLAGLKTGHFATIADMSIPASGHPVVPEVFIAKFRQMVTDLKKSCPRNVPFNVIVDWQSDIRLRSVVMALPQGALVPNGEVISTALMDHRTLESTALAESEEIAAAARGVSRSAIDVGNMMAAEGEWRPIRLAEVSQTMAGSRDEYVSRSTYGRARGPEAHIHYPDGDHRTVGGAKSIPAIAHSEEVFELQRCNLRITKQGALELTTLEPNEDWNRLHVHTPGIDLVQGEADSPIHNCLLVAAKAGVLVDMTVCVTEKIATGERWCTPISIQNKDDVFVQGHEWLTFLQESLGS